MKKPKVILKTPVGKSWFHNKGTPSINYCGLSMYQYTITTSPKRERLNIVYEVTNSSGWIHLKEVIDD